MSPSHVVSALKTMHARNFQEFFQQTCCPRSSQAESAKRGPLGTKGSEIFLLSGKNSADVTKSAKKEEPYAQIVFLWAFKDRETR